MTAQVTDILMRLAAAGFLGACIGFERRVHHKAIGIAGMVLIAIGSTTYMLLGRHFGESDPAAISRTLQGFLSGIGFLGGAVIFKSGFDVKGIRPPPPCGLPARSASQWRVPFGGWESRSAWSPLL